MLDPVKTVLRAVFVATKSDFCFSRKCNNAGNLLHLQLLRNLKDIYHATDRPLHCQYGAITALAMLGDYVCESICMSIHFKLLNVSETGWNV